MKGIRAGLMVIFASLAMNAARAELRFDFESGDLQGWEVVAGTFHRPVKSHGKQPKKPGGRFFLSTEGATVELENSPNHLGGEGILESPVFVVRGDEATFLAGGKGGRLWMDVSAPYAGTYAASGTGFPKLSPREQKN